MYDQSGYANQQSSGVQGYGNTSGQGQGAIVPPEVQGLNWGAFLLNWIWGLGNRTYLALLTFIPFVGWIMVFVLLFKGNEWAWQNKQWDSVEAFKATQRKWAIAGVAVIVGCIVLGCVLGGFLGVLGALSGSSSK